MNNINYDSELNYKEKRRNQNSPGLLSKFINSNWPLETFY